MASLAKAVVPQLHPIRALAHHVLVLLSGQADEPTRYALKNGSGVKADRTYAVPPCLVHLATHSLAPP
jgi:hypothetical protein